GGKVALHLLQLPYRGTAHDKLYAGCGAVHLEPLDELPAHFFLTEDVVAYDQVRLDLLDALHHLRLKRRERHRMTGLFMEYHAEKLQDFLGVVDGHDMLGTVGSHFACPATLR